MKHKDSHKLKSTALLVFCMLLSLPSFSQHFDWVKSYSANEPLWPSWNPYNFIVSSVTDSHGNLYVAGRLANGAAIDGQDLLPITPHGNHIATIIASLSNSLPKDRFCGRKFFIQMMRCLVMSRRCILLVIQHYI